MLHRASDQMRSYVIFRHPAELVTLSEEDGILATCGAEWFVGLLRRVPGLELEDELVQEDWGVVLFARFEQKQFWIGLSYWPDGENAWLAHVHHRGWLQRRSSSGRQALEGLLTAANGVLSSEPSVGEVAWYEELHGVLNPERFDGPIG